MNSFRVQEIQATSVLHQELVLGRYTTNSVFDFCDQSRVFCDRRQGGLRIRQVLHFRGQKRFESI